MSGRNNGRAIWAAWMVFSMLILFFFSHWFWRGYWVEDEGYDVMKPLLMQQGYRLYGDIWDDQPPLFAYFLWGWFKLFGFSLPAGRILVTLFSLVLLYASFDTVRKINGYWGAWATVSILFLSPHFFESASSVLIGTPCISFLMLSLNAAVTYSKERTFESYAFSTLFFIAALGVKFMAFLGLPALVLVWVLSERFSFSGVARHLRGLLWIVAASGIVTWWAGEQLFQTHLHTGTHYPIVNWGEIFSWIVSQPHAVFLSALALFSVGTIRFRSIFPFLFWFLQTLLIFFAYRPIWYYYSIFLCLPLAILAGLGMNEGIRSGFFLKWTKAMVVGTAITLLLLHLPHVLRENMKFLEQHRVVEMRLDEMSAILEKIPKEQGPVLMDRPIVAFEQGKTVIPELCVFSPKRFFIGQITDAYMVALLRKYRPPFIGLISGFTDTFKQMREFIGKNYTPVALRGGNFCYVHKRLGSPAFSDGSVLISN